jgi:RHS repeat-associated protein
MLLACHVLYGMGSGNEKSVTHEDLYQGSLRTLVKRGTNHTVALAAYKDYYPYGQLMPGRNYQTTDYRYGYQGQYAETDPETGFAHFEAREFDSRLGRWMVPDPARQHWSPYLGMGNNPVSGVDPDGMRDGWWKTKGSEGNQTTEWYPVDEIAAANPNLEYVGDENYTFGTVGIDGPTISAGMSQSYASAAKLGIYSAHHNFWENPFVKGTTFVLTGLVGGEIVSGLNYAYKAFSTYRYAGMGANAAKSGAQTAYQIGRAGEEAVGTLGPKTRILVNGRIRIPDALTRTTLTEVKNVKSLSFTRQLRDFSTFSQQTGRQFMLYTRSNTVLSAPLQQAIDNGLIIQKIIPGL